MIQGPHRYPGTDGSRSRSLSTVANVTRTVFYAWQSDCPSGTNRGFIREALKRAVKRDSTLMATRSKLMRARRVLLACPT